MAGAAKRFIQTLSDHVMARETLMEALPPGSRITITVQLGANGMAKNVRFSTESDLSKEDVTMGSVRHLNGNGR